jgi:SagB-type dehydrogenase family enzyme
MIEDDARANREFLKDSIRQMVDFSLTDQAQGKPAPPIAKPAAADAERIALPGPDAWPELGAMPIRRAIALRASHRRFGDEPLALSELAFLLWATQGIRQRLSPAVALRTVPSAGARHALETYLAVFAVDGLRPAVYRYRPIEHELVLEFEDPDLPRRVSDVALGQSFAGQSAVTFAWSAIPYRMEWRYGPVSHKVIAMDAGHACQNLYLACTAIDAGTCAIAAYDQQRADRLFRLDGHDEFIVYLAPVGKV